MVDDLDAMRERDHPRAARKLYGHPSTAKARERTPATRRRRSQALRHRDEIAEQQARHHGESQTHYQKHRTGTRHAAADINSARWQS